MNYEDLFLLSMILCNFLLAWNFSLLESRCFWRKKWEEELNRNERF